MTFTRSRNRADQPSRRGFLAAPLLAAMPAMAANRITRSRVSAITDEIARSPEGAIEFAKQYGLEWLELRSVPGGRKEYFQLSEAELREAAKQFRDAGVKISFLNTSMLKYAMPGAVNPNPQRRWDVSRFEKRQQELEQSIAAARILGVNKVRVFTFLRAADREQQIPKVAEILNQMAETAAKEKIHLLIENEGACNVATCGELVELLKQVPSKWLGINWDPLNAANKQEVAFPDGYNMLPNKRIQNVQIKGRSILPGPQLMDWAEIFRRLEKDGYKGQVGLETHIFGEIQVQKSHESIREILRLVTS
ncbi:MAG: sugar phosphate isomerase/epimerase [Acidimicrobiia bacterium]|nr:sugar phosphate isomerase/epimerase [Acidimicrobiia bacterium]